MSGYSTLNCVDCGGETWIPHGSHRRAYEWPVCLYCACTVEIVDRTPSPMLVAVLTAVWDMPRCSAGRAGLGRQVESITGYSLLTPEERAAWNARVDRAIEEGAGAGYLTVSTTSFGGLVIELTATGILVGANGERPE